MGENAVVFVDEIQGKLYARRIELFNIYYDKEKKSIKQKLNYANNNNLVNNYFYSRGKKENEFLVKKKTELLMHVNSESFHKVKALCILEEKENPKICLFFREDGKKYNYTLLGSLFAPELSASAVSFSTILSIAS